MMLGRRRNAAALAVEAEAGEIAALDREAQAAEAAPLPEPEPAGALPPEVAEVARRVRAVHPSAPGWWIDQHAEVVAAWRMARERQATEARLTAMAARVAERVPLEAIRAAFDADPEAQPLRARRAELTTARQRLADELAEVERELAEVARQPAEPGDRVARLLVGDAAPGEPAALRRSRLSERLARLRLDLGDHDRALDRLRARLEGANLDALRRALVAHGDPHAEAVARLASATHELARAVEAESELLRALSWRGMPGHALRRFGEPLDVALPLADALAREVEGNG